MTLRFNQIAEANLRNHNPLTAQQLILLGEICGFEEKQRVLDLAVGKGEALVQWSREFGVVGVGVEANEDYVQAAQDRAYRMDVGNTTNFVVGEAADYPEDHHEFDYVSYLGSAWLGDTFAARVSKMRQALNPKDGFLLIGETYWRQLPTVAACDVLGVSQDTFLTLADLDGQARSAHVELVEMVLPNPQQIDRYEAQQWLAVNQFLHENPDDRDAVDLKRWMNANRQLYLEAGRDYLGWGVFVLRPAGTIRSKPQSAHRLPDHPIAVDIDPEMIWVSLHDGRIIGNPLAWYPVLLDLDEATLQAVELRATSIQWPSIGVSISIKQMLRGRG